MSCLKCKEPAVKNGLCKKHYIASREEIYLDNTDENNPGIIQWLKDFLPVHFRNEFPKEHTQIYLDYLRLYDSLYKNKIHRYLEIIAYRGFAKSKIIMGIISYCIAHNGQTVKINRRDGTPIEIKIQESFMVIASETGGMAETFVINIRTEFAGNNKLKYFYRIMIEDAQDSLDKEWTKRAFKINGIYILGVGQGMQIRGRVKGAYRITSMFFDDIYSENNTITPESRIKIKSWFDNAALNSIDDLDGKAMLVGTIVHEDTVIVECEKNKLWKHIKIAVMPIEKFNKFIKHHLSIDVNTGKCDLPFEDIESESEKINKQSEYFAKLEEKEDWELIWKERAGLYFLAMKYQETIYKNQLNGFYQEYFHITIPEGSRRFKREYFQEIKKSEYRIFEAFGYQWFECSKLYNQPKLINISFGIDTASGMIDGDDSVIEVVGALPDGRIIALEDVYGKYGMRDEVRDDHYNNLRFGKVVMDKEYVTKVGYVDEAFRLAIKWKPYRINCGVAGKEIEYVNVMRQVFNNNRIYTMITVRPQESREGNKISRITNNLINLYSTLMIFHTEGMEKKEGQLEFLGKAKNDDLADAMEVACKNIMFPSDIDYKSFTDVKKYKPKLGQYKYVPDNFDWRVN